MKLRRNNDTFDSLNDRANELRQSIADSKAELAEVITKLDDYKTQLERDFSFDYKELGVKPSFSI
jgi:uncharacterized coiled-coil protein SlyX